jgi:hypothetical protein
LPPLKAGFSVALKVILRHFWTIRCRRILYIIFQERSGLTNMVYFCVWLASGKNTVFMIHTLFNDTKHGFGEIFRLEFSTGMV